MKERLVISRTDSIGDVVLTLPLASYLKSKFPNRFEIFFLGKNYTKDVIESCPDIDQFISYDENYLEQLSQLKVDWFVHVFPRKHLVKEVKSLKIPHIVGTFNRLYHWGKCQHLIRFSRKNSHLHEAQLNFHLLRPIIGKQIPSLHEITQTLNFNSIRSLNSLDKKTIIFHPMSNGSAVDWPFEKFRQLGRELFELGYKIAITGTSREGEVLKKEFSKEFEQDVFIDQTGKYSLKELINYISSCHALVASSTGPLHLAGITGIHAIGLFSQVRPIHAGRWSPIGRHVHIVEADDKDQKPSISEISVQDVKKVLDSIQSSLQ